MKLSEPISVIRKKKITELKEILNETQEEGSVCILRGMDGIGKTTFLHTVKEHLENDESVSCVYEAVRQADNTQFFLQLLTDLKLKTHPKKEKIKKFFEDHFTILQSVVGVAGAVTGQSELASAAMEPFAPVSVPQLNTTIQDEFIKILSEFSQKFTDHKVIIMIDGIDSTLGKNLFVAMINDLATRLPPRFLIVVNSSSKEIEYSSQLFISNFTEEEVREFLEKNFENIDEALIEEITEKSAGYPDSLGWLWRNYKRNSNILPLVKRLPSDGFLVGLQKNFLEQLSAQSRSILKICAALDIVDSMALSHLTNIEQHEANMIIADFNESGYLTIIENTTGPTGQIFTFYHTDRVIIKLFNAISGKDKDLARRATDFFAKSVLNNTYILPIYPYGKILALNLSIDNQSYDVKQLFDSIDLDAEKKCLIWVDLTNKLMMSQNQNAYAFLAIINSLSRDLKDQNEANSLVEYANLKKLIFDKIKQQGANVTAEYLESVYRDPSIVLAINRLETMILQINESSNLRKFVMNELNFFKTLGTTKFDSDYWNTILDKQIENTIKTQLDSIQNKRVAEFLAGNMVGIGFLDTIPIMAFLCFARQRELYESLTDEELKIIESYIKSKGAQYNIQDIEDNLVFYSDITYLWYASQFLESENITDDDKNDMRSIVEELEYWKDDPVKGQYYVKAKELLEDMEQSSPASNK